MKMLPPRTVVEQPTNRGPGRPSLSKEPDVPAARVNLFLPPEDYDGVQAIARERRITLNEAIRQAVRRMIRDERGTTLAENKRRDK